MNIHEAEQVTGGLTRTDKMPCASYNLPAAACKTGSALRKIKGSVCSHCYACKNRYLFPSTQNALRRRLDSIAGGGWGAGMSILIKKQSPAYFRWHDSGDVQSAEHLSSIIGVVEATADTRHWLPTLEHKMVAGHFNGTPVPANMVVRFSTAMMDGEPSDFCLAANKTDGGFVFSRVASSVKDGEYACPATWNVAGKCGDCRACWSRSVPMVVYKRH